MTSYTLTLVKTGAGLIRADLAFKINNTRQSSSNSRAEFMYPMSASRLSLNQLVFQTDTTWPFYRVDSSLETLLEKSTLYIKTF